MQIRLLNRSLSSTLSNRNTFLVFSISSLLPFEVGARRRSFCSNLPLRQETCLTPQYASSSRSRAGSDDNAPSRDEASSEEDQRSSNDESLSGGESKSTVVSSSEKEEVEKNEDEAEEGNEKEYLLASMTVPCAHFPSGHATFVMTVSYFVCCRNTSFR